MKSSILTARQSGANSELNIDDSVFTVVVFEQQESLLSLKSIMSRWLFRQRVRGFLSLACLFDALLPVVVVLRTPFVRPPIVFNTFLLS